MFIWTEYSTKQVFKSARPERDSKNSKTLCTAANAYVSAQVVLRELADFTVTDVKAEAPENVAVRLFAQKYRMYNDRVDYPDELAPVEEALPLEVKAHAAQSFWVDFFVPSCFAGKTFESKVTVITSHGEFAACFTVNVSETVIPDSNRGCFNHEYFFDFNDKNVSGAKTFSDEWWEYTRMIARVFKELRCNAVVINSFPLLAGAGSRKTGDGKWTFDFSLWDRYVDLFIKEGAAKTFTISAMIQSVEGKTIGTLGGNSEHVTMNTMTEEAAEYLRQYYGAIYEHIKGNGTLKLFRTHIEDEPHTTDAWRWARAIIAEVAPELPAGEPLDMIESAHGLCDVCDVMVPRINVYEEDPEFFEKAIAGGREVWTYSCCFPEEGWWINKFVDMPFIRSRLMEWVCALTGAKGFLHWGFNYYGSQLYGLFDDARFKGDGHIVYPDPEHKKYNLSARFINTRDGIQDVEAYLIRREDNADLREVLRGAAENYYTYDENPETFEERLKALLGFADRA